MIWSVNFLDRLTSHLVQDSCVVKEIKRKSLDVKESENKFLDLLFFSDPRQMFLWSIVAL